ncbi:DUF4040 domain-containing protein [Myxococcota bacterium]|nr:DUF4040 domain-containing protein [Myxococcota bacterium]MBU1431807.1 DUF4040 domain-containing protein [Myxococcota bacterium]MBU1896655.1 DUF4040 domain-containing protein [Myxococcota bacterium]
MCLVMIAAALMTFFSRNLISAVIFSGAVSLVAAYLFLRMGAPDVAMTEAAIGSGLTTVIFLITIRRTQEVEA